jgi:hypothetical protein
MPIPKYVPKKKHKQYRKEHKEIAKTVKGKVKSPYAVATSRLKIKYKK